MKKDNNGSSPDSPPLKTLFGHAVLANDTCECRFSFEVSPLPSSFHCEIDIEPRSGPRILRHRSIEIPMICNSHHDFLGVFELRTGSAKATFDFSPNMQPPLAQYIDSVQCVNACWKCGGFINPIITEFLEVLVRYIQQSCTCIMTVFNVLIIREVSALRFFVVLCRTPSTIVKQSYDCLRMILVDL